jgi:hypothetical protein
MRMDISKTLSTMENLFGTLPSTVQHGRGYLLCKWRCAQENSNWAKTSTEYEALPLTVHNKWRTSTEGERKIWDPHQYFGTKILKTIWNCKWIVRASRGRRSFHPQELLGLLLHQKRIPLVSSQDFNMGWRSDQGLGIRDCATPHYPCSASKCVHWR